MLLLAAYTGYTKYINACMVQNHCYDVYIHTIMYTRCKAIGTCTQICCIWGLKPLICMYKHDMCKPLVCVFIHDVSKSLVYAPRVCVRVECTKSKVMLIHIIVMGVHRLFVKSCVPLYVDS